jgi:aryl-alcohol dehydrogenase-like predicted oxidoreductase
MRRRDFTWLLSSLTLAPSLVLRAGAAPSPGMTYGQVPGFDGRLSRLVQGTTTLQNTPEWLTFLDAICAHGCNAFDTARAYQRGESERVLGRWMRERKNRDKVVIISKGGESIGDFRQADLEKELHESLRDLGVSEIDLYLIHRDDPKVPAARILETLAGFRKQGKIKAYGCSNWSHTRIGEAMTAAKKMSLPGFSLSSPQWSLTEWTEPPWPGTYSISGPSHQKERDWYRANQMPVLTWSSVSSGAIAPGYFDKAPASDEQRQMRKTYGGAANLERYKRAAQMAKKKNVGVFEIGLAYLYSQPLNTFAIVNVNKIEYFTDNAKAMSLKLTPAELRWLETGV